MAQRPVSILLASGRGPHRFWAAMW